MVKLPDLKYHVDPKLKEDKDFPPALALVIDVLNAIPLPGQLPFLSVGSKKTPMLPGIAIIPDIAKHFNPDNFNKAKLRKYLKEVALLEKTFLEFFRQPFSLHGGVLSYNPSRKLARRINSRMKSLHPSLRTIPWGYRIDRFTQQQKEFRPLVFWGHLAEVVSYPLLPRFFHQCPSCEKVFFSRQKKRFDSRVCKNKYLSKMRFERKKAREDARL